MKKIAVVGLIVVVATLALVPPSEAHGRRYYRPHRSFHSRVIIGFGPAFYPYPYYYYPPPYVVYSPPPTVVYSPPPVVVQEPPVYVQQPTPLATPPPATSQSVEAYWYFCQSANAYYPSVSSCPEAWVKVPPRP